MEKLKYAKWKAADITNAIKEGRVPTPGPAGGDEELFDEAQFMAMTGGVGAQQPTGTTDMGLAGQPSYIEPSGYQSQTFNPPSQNPIQPEYQPQQAGRDVYSFDPLPPNFVSSVPGNYQNQINFNPPPTVTESDFPDPPMSYEQHSQYSNAPAGNVPSAMEFNEPPPSMSWGVPTTSPEPVFVNGQVPQQPQNQVQSMPTYQAPPVTPGNMNSSFEVVKPQFTPNTVPPQQPTPQYTPQPVQVTPQYAPQQASAPVRQPWETQTQAPVNRRSTPAPVYTGTPNMDQAYRYGRFAVSALQFEDVPSAIENLKNALILLGVKTG